MSKDLTKLSRKELETKLRKKYGVDKYLNQRSQLLSLLGMKGETDIETGFTGPETEALSIMFENIKKAEGGIISAIDNPKRLPVQKFKNGAFVAAGCGEVQENKRKATRIF